MIAMQFCLARPERVLGLVIQSSGTALAEGLPKEVMDAMILDRDATFNALIDHFQLWDKAVLQRILEGA